jgi:hypothetical protein
MKRKFIWHGGQWRDVTNAKRAPRVGPYIVTDAMKACFHPATGEMMDSKSAFRRVTREHGMVEMGNDAPAMTAPAHDMGSVAQDVAQAYQMLEQGYTPPPVESAGSLDGADVETRLFS